MSGGLTAREIADRTGYPVRGLQERLLELEEAGLVERAGARWRLSRGAEREFGRVFRDLPEFEDEEAA
jgi:DNA-binding IclR family transcriptional regulator